jgi:hypothetical protein
MSKAADSRPPAYQAGSAAADARPSEAKLAEPSWPEVIATTLRLWLRRRVLHDQALPTGRRPALRRRAGAFSLALVIIAAAALTIVMALRQDAAGTHHAAAQPGSAQAVQLSTAALAVAQTNRKNAAAWAVAQVSRSAIVSCDPVMCSDLQGHGFPAGDLLVLGPGATDPLGSAIVLSTTALRNQFGRRLADVYAPAVLASFGTGAARVDVRVEAADGTGAYVVAQRADLLARQASGQQLLRNKHLHAAGISRHDLSAGRVDSRLLITLAALTAQEHRVYIAEFGDIGPHASAGVPMRMVRIAGLVSGRRGHRFTYLHSVLKFLRAQRAPFRARTSVVHLPGNKTDVQIQFDAPSALGLLGAHASP